MLKNKRTVLRAAALAAVLMSLLLCYFSLDVTSPTYDEPNYLSAAQHVVETFSFDRKNTILHPPLTYLLNGLILKWAPSDAFGASLNNVRMVDLVLFLLVTAVLVWFWSRALFGNWGALLSVTVFVFCPIVMAHARLATTDMAACCTLFGAFFFLWRLFGKPTIAGTIAAGLFIGAALLAKYSTVLLFPILIVICSVAKLPAGWKDRVPGAVDARIPQPKLPFIHLLAASVLGIIVLLAGYGFKGLFIPLAEGDFQSGFFTLLAGVPGMSDLPFPLPEPYLMGLDFQKHITETGFTSFLLGEKYYQGVWYYFPVCFLLKMPIPFILLVAAGAWQMIRRHTGRPCARLFTLLPPLLFFIYLVYPNTSNAGFRYALPVVPFLSVIAGACVRFAGAEREKDEKKPDRKEKKKEPPKGVNNPRELAGGLVAKFLPNPAAGTGPRIGTGPQIGKGAIISDTPAEADDSAAPGEDIADTADTKGPPAEKVPKKGAAALIRRWGPPAVLAAAVLWLLAGTLLVHPYYLAYHNEAAGGPGEAFRIMAGSDLDWGQDDGAAREAWMDRRTSDGHHLYPGILPVTGRILINTNRLNDVLRPRDIHGWLRGFEPVDNIGYTWLDYSVSLDDFRQRAADNPDDAVACYAYAGALLHQGRQKDCREELDRGLALFPDSGPLHFLEGVFYNRTRERQRSISALKKAAEVDPLFLESYTPLRFLLILNGRREEADGIRRAQIEAEIRTAHVLRAAFDKKALAEKAYRSLASPNELCTLSVLAWLDGEESEALAFGRDAVKIDPLNIQAVGNLLFLEAERSDVGTFNDAYTRAGSLLGKLDLLQKSTKAHTTSTVGFGGDRIVFGSILTFLPPSWAEVDARSILRGTLRTDAPELCRTVRRLIDERRLPEALELVLKGKELFPGNQTIHKLETYLNGQADRI